MSDFLKDEELETTEDVAVEEVAEETAEVEEGPKDDLDESLDAIEEAKAEEDENYDEENNFIGEPEDELGLEEGEVDWASPEFTPEESDLPMSFEIVEALGESMEMEGDAILDVLGPSGNEALDEIILEKEPTVSYPEPDNADNIVQEVIEDAEGGSTAEVEGLTTESGRDEFVGEGDHPEDGDNCDEECEEDVDGEDAPLELTEEDLED